MAIVFAVEQVLRELLQPEKINLASLGNQVPHLHWHVIPRFSDDAHFPDPIWAPRKREARPRAISPDVLAERLRERLVTAG
jgi:diadenosine tetraphosphate (Ap4A) HIT family hydrolase